MSVEKCDSLILLLKGILLTNLVEVKVESSHVPFTAWRRHHRRQFWLRCSLISHIALTKTSSKLLVGEEVGAKVGLEGLTGRSSLRLLTEPVAWSAPSILGFCGTSLVGDLLRSLLAIDSLLLRCTQSLTLEVVSLRRSNLINNRFYIPSALFPSNGAILSTTSLFQTTSTALRIADRPPSLARRWKDSQAAKPGALTVAKPDGDGQTLVTDAFLGSGKRTERGGTEDETDGTLVRRALVLDAFHLFSLNAHTLSVRPARVSDSVAFHVDIAIDREALYKDSSSFQLEFFVPLEPSVRTFGFLSFCAAFLASTALFCASETASAIRPCVVEEGGPSSSCWECCDRFSLSNGVTERCRQSGVRAPDRTHSFACSGRTHREAAEERVQSSARILNFLPDSRFRVELHVDVHALLLLAETAAKVLIEEPAVVDASELSVCLCAETLTTHC